MEDQGDFGTALTHWEKRLFGDEAMTGRICLKRFFSERFGTGRLTENYTSFGTIGGQPLMVHVMHGADVIICSVANRMCSAANMMISVADTMWPPLPHL